MEKNEVKKILFEAALMAEKAYRRGFQHGVWFSNCSDAAFKIKASDFRFFKSLKKTYTAPQRDFDGKLTKFVPFLNPVRRHFMEIETDPNFKILPKVSRELESECDDWRKLMSYNPKKNNTNEGL